MESTCFFSTHHHQKVSARQCLSWAHDLKLLLFLADGRLKLRYLFHSEKPTAEKNALKNDPKDLMCAAACLVRHPFVSCDVLTFLSEFTISETTRWTDHVKAVNAGKFHKLKSVN